jgi:hypothetical protein
VTSRGITIPVGTGLPWADGVEEAGDDHLSAGLVVVAVGEHLAEDLCGCIAPARLLRRADDPVGILAQAVVGELAVDLGGGGEDQAGLIPGGGGGDVVGAADIPQQRFERLLNHELDSHRGGEVEAGIGFLHRVVDEAIVEN